MPKRSEHALTLARPYLNAADEVISNLEEFYARTSEEVKQNCAFVKNKHAWQQVQHCPIAAYMIHALAFTQKDIARILDVTPRSVVSYLNGATVPSSTAKITLALVFRQIQRVMSQNPSHTPEIPKSPKA